MLKLFLIQNIAIFILFSAALFADDETPTKEIAEPGLETVGSKAHQFAFGITQDALNDLGFGVHLTSFYLENWPLTIEYQSTNEARESGFVNSYKSGVTVSADYTFGANFISLFTRKFLSESFYFKIGVSRRSLDMDVDIRTNTSGNSTKIKKMSNLGMIQSVGNRWWLTDNVEISIDWYKIFVNMATESGGSWGGLLDEYSVDSQLRSTAERIIESNTDTALNVNISYGF